MKPILKPILNIDEVQLEPFQMGEFEGAYGQISSRLGAKKLGYNLSVIPPGKSICPFHNHWVNEEMLLILEGKGRLRYGEQEFSVTAWDIIACPAGDRQVAHQLFNSGLTDLKFLALSTKEPSDIVEYPDTKKIGASVGHYPNYQLQCFFKTDTQVGYLD